MGAIEIHPWGASIDAIDYPDRLIFDLDPAPDVPFEALKLAAMDPRQRVGNKGLDSSLKCTGGKGLHVTVTLDGKDRWAAVKAFGAAVAEEMVSAAPEAYVATMSKAKRTGKIFIDYFRNDYTATAIADYSVRARPGAPVAVPLEWDELKGLRSASAFTLKRMKNRKA
jgi:bifunctional non-homologous end joining protein LigD